MIRLYTDWGRVVRFETKMRKVYILPNLVTTANMFSGFYSIIASIQGDFLLAAWAIIAASVFDLLDGRIARMARATSSFGVQYDSLSDLISFGAAPGILLFLWTLQPYGRLGWLAAFLLLACGAFRLARFNVSSSVFPNAYFQGLPIPISAGVVATFVIFNFGTGTFPFEACQIISLVFAFGLSALMVSAVPFPSFKELNWRSKGSFGYLLVGVFAMILIATRPEITLFLLVMGYVLGSLGWNSVNLVRGTLPEKTESRSLSSSEGDSQ